MNISKRMLVKIVIVFLVGSVTVYGFMQYSSLTNMQVQTQQKFRVTVRWFAGPSSICYSPWQVHVEQLSHEELENGWVQVSDFPRQIRNGWYPPDFYPKTWDGRAQMEYGTFFQPKNVTIVWDGGSEIFLFNELPTIKWVIPDSPRVAIQSVAGNATASAITIYGLSTRGTGVFLNSCVIKDTSGSVQDIIDATSIDYHDAETAVAVSSIGTKLTRLDIATTPGAMVVGESYIVILVMDPFGECEDSPTFKAVA